MKIIKINFKKISKKEIDLIVDYFKKGKVVVYPTDTIYGLGCIADNKKAIDKIYKIKKREKKKPFIILVGSLGMLKKYCFISREQEKFLRQVWKIPPTPSNPPYPLYQGGTLKGAEKKSLYTPFIKGGRPVTVILKGKGVLPKELNGGTDSLAVRLPKNEFLIEIIRKAGAPIVSTSANISGEEYKGALKNINKSFGVKIDLIVNAGRLRNKPSKIIDITDIKNIIILRK